MDILRVVGSPDMDVRRKALEIALDMVSSRNVEEVIGFLKKELIKTLDGTFEKVSYSSSRVIQSRTLISNSHSRLPNIVNSSFKRFTLAPSNTQKSLPRSFTSLWSSSETLQTLQLSTLSLSFEKLSRNSPTFEVESSTNSYKLSPRSRVERCSVEQCG